MTVTLNRACDTAAVPRRTGNQTLVPAASPSNFAIRQRHPAIANEPAIKIPD